MTDLQSNIATLVALDPTAIGQLEQHLGTSLEVTQDDAHMTVRSGQGGSLEGMALAAAEQRAMKDDPARTLIVVDFAQSSPASADEVKQQWPEAVFSPPRPNAPAAAGYWSLPEAGGAVIKLGATAAMDGITRIVVDRMGK